MKIEGSGSASGSGSINQRHGSADPDPDPDPSQNVMDPPHHFKEVLDSIEQHRLLSPLLVVSTLSTCPTATLGVVRFVPLAPGVHS